MRENKKDISDHISKVIDCQWTGADCECCGNYDEYTVDLSCFCQIVQNKRANVGGLMRCPVCSGDYDEVDETPTVSE